MAKVAQTIEDTGPLTKKRMETIDEELWLACSKDLLSETTLNSRFLLVECDTHALSHPC